MHDHIFHKTIIFLLCLLSGAGLYILFFPLPVEIPDYSPLAQAREYPLQSLVAFTFLIWGLAIWQNIHVLISADYTRKQQLEFFVKIKQFLKVITAITGGVSLLLIVALFVLSNIRLGTNTLETLACDLFFVATGICGLVQIVDSILDAVKKSRFRHLYCR